MERLCAREPVMISWYKYDYLWFEMITGLTSVRSPHPRERFTEGVQRVCQWKRTHG